MANEPKSAADRDKLEEALGRLSREDPTFHTTLHEETGQTIISGLGELHLEVLKHRLVSDFKVQANVGKPRVSYRQTVRGRGEAEHTFERLIQGKEQVATVRSRVEPAEAGSGTLVGVGEPGESGLATVRPAGEEGGLVAAPPEACSLPVRPLSCRTTAASPPPAAPRGSRPAPWSTRPGPARGTGPSWSSRTSGSGRPCPG